MGKPTGAAVAARAIRAVAEGHTYAEMDCQALVEYCVTECGGAMAYAGSNDMARNAVTALWTLAEAKKLGKLVPGAGVFIHADDGGEPAKYRADGMGNYSHVGYYVGEKALTDTDKNGKSRVCNCVASGQTMGRVAGSTLANGWTHVGWFAAIDYGAADSAKTDDAGSDAETVPEAAGTTVDVSGFYLIRRGCKGGAVERLQTWLADLGFTLSVDHDFGPTTEAMVKVFQRDHGLTMDGIVGPKTWAALAEARAAAAKA